MLWSSQRPTGRKTSTLHCSGALHTNGVSANYEAKVHTKCASRAFYLTGTHPSASKLWLPLLPCYIPYHAKQQLGLLSPTSVCQEFWRIENVRFASWTQYIHPVTDFRHGSGNNGLPWDFGSSRIGSTRTGMCRMRRASDNAQTPTFICLHVPSL